MKTTMRRFLSLVVGVITAAGITVPSWAFAGEKTFLKSAGDGALYRVYPDTSRDEKDSILFLELKGAPYERGLQHGRLLAGQIADVIGNRYACIGEDVLDWTQAAYDKMPVEWQDEIRGIMDGLSQTGYDFPFAKIILHATQVPVYGTQFPWFSCPWGKPANPTGSFSYAVWGDYVAGGGTLATNSPDWGAVPQSLTRNRVLVSVGPDSGFRFAYLGVAGVVGMPGVNETGLSIAGTSGPESAGGIVTPQPGGPIPDGFMPLLLVARHTLQYLDAGRSDVFEQYEELLGQNPIEGFHVHLSSVRDGRSAVWESGAARSPDYPRIARREAGGLGNTPIDYRGDIVLTPEPLRISALPFPVNVEFADSNGEAYSGTADIDSAGVRWQRVPLGSGYFLPRDPNRQTMFDNWFANLGRTTILMAAPPAAVSNLAEIKEPDAIASVRPDKTGGFWVYDDDTFGSWVRDGDFAFRAFSSDGAEVCAGPLYDFGNGVTGWCMLGDNDVEFVAWTHQYPAGAGGRLDGMNLSVLPTVKPWAKVEIPLFKGPHARTQFLLRELGAPKGTLSLEEFYKIFQRAYLATGNADAPFGVGVYDLQNLSAMFTVSRYEGEQYIGGLNPAQKPIALNRYQLFGR